MPRVRAEAELGQRQRVRAGALVMVRAGARTNVKAMVI